MTEPYRQILGIRFFVGSAREAVALGLQGGLVVVPSGPVLLTMADDPATAEALLHSDLAITDSGLMVLVWRWMRGEKLIRVSGLEYLRLLLEEPSLREPGALFWVMPSGETLEKSLAYLRGEGFPITRDDCYIAPFYGEGAVSDPVLLEIINRRKPAHIVMAIGGGVQEKLGYFLKRGAVAHPGIHCTGAAIGFLSGDQARIPHWADRWFLGWLMRCLQEPGRFIPRYWAARRLVALMLKYGERFPRG